MFKRSEKIDPDDAALLFSQCLQLQDEWLERNERKKEFGSPVCAWGGGQWLSSTSNMCLLRFSGGHAINAVFFLQRCNTVQLILSFSLTFTFTTITIVFLKGFVPKWGRQIWDWTKSSGTKPSVARMSQKCLNKFPPRTAPHVWLFFFYCTWAQSTPLHSVLMQHVKAEISSESWLIL